MKRIRKSLLILVLCAVYLFPSLAFCENAKAVFSGGMADISGSGITLKKNKLEISGSGVYELSGDTELPVRVKTGAGDTVTLVLNGFSVRSEDESPLRITGEGRAMILCAEGTQNTLCCVTEETAAQASAPDDEEKLLPALLSKVPLTLGGKGSLTLETGFGDGIRAKGDIDISDVSISISASRHGIRCVSCNISSGSISIHAGTDGLHAEGGEDIASGVSVSGGEITAVTGEDGIQADTIMVSGGTVSLVCGGGSESAPKKYEGPGFSSYRNESETAESFGKGLKASQTLTVSGGSIICDTRDDALHSNGQAGITGGSILITAGDDGIHADRYLNISGGTVTAKAFEGLEAVQIMISGGNIHLETEDDGINANGGDDTPAFGGGFRGGPGGREHGRRDHFGFGREDQRAPGTPPPAPGNEDAAPLPPDDDPFSFGSGPSGGREDESTADGQAELSPLLRITGGTVYVLSRGDGLDSNGDLVIEGGSIRVDGPENGANGALDSGSENGGSLTVSGGSIIALGASGMAEYFSETSLQYSVAFTSRSPFSAGTPVLLSDSEGGELVSMVSAGSFSSAVISCPALADGGSYTLTVGEEVYPFTASSPVTLLGSGASSGRSGPFGFPGR